MNYAKKMYILDNTALELSLLGGSNRELWVRPSNRERETFGEFHHVFPQLRNDPAKFCDYFQMSPATFDYILALVSPLIEKNTTNFRRPISPGERLSVTLRYMVAGTPITGLASEFRMGGSTVAMIVAETCKALWEVLQPLHMPTPNEMICKKAEEGFRTKWNFPNCFGCIDGKHVRISWPDKFNSKLKYSKHYYIVLHGIADANCKFITIDVGTLVQQNDKEIFRNSDLYLSLETNAFNVPTLNCLPNSNIKTPFVILGNDAYPLLTYLMRPFHRSCLDDSKKIFNYRLSRARRCVEYAFGIMTKKFRILQRSIAIKADSAVHLLQAACVIHNTIIDREGIDYSLTDDDPVKPTTWPSINKDKIRSRHIALVTRDKFTDYFVSAEGSVPWQNFFV